MFSHCKWLSEKHDSQTSTQLLEISEKNSACLQSPSTKAAYTSTLIVLVWVIPARTPGETQQKGKKNIGRRKKKEYLRESHPTAQMGEGRQAWKINKTQKERKKGEKKHVSGIKYKAY